MSAELKVPPRAPAKESEPGPTDSSSGGVEFRHTQTESFVALLQQPGASLLVSTYQANKLLVVRAAGVRTSLTAVA